MEKILMDTNNWKALDACRAGKNGGRETLKNININDQHVESTNGKIAIRFKLESLSLPTITPGAYKVISATKYSKLFTELVLELAPDVQYPDTKTIFPENRTAGEKLTIEILPERSAPLNISSAMIQIFKLTGNAYTHENISTFAVLKEHWAVYNQGESRFIYLTNSAGTIEALVMPFKIN